MMGMALEWIYHLRCTHIICSPSSSSALLRSRNVFRAPRLMLAIEQNLSLSAFAQSGFRLLLRKNTLLFFVVISLQAALQLQLEE